MFQERIYNIWVCVLNFKRLENSTNLSTAFGSLHTKKVVVAESKCVHSPQPQPRSRASAQGRGWWNMPGWSERTLLSLWAERWWWHGEGFWGRCTNILSYNSDYNDRLSINHSSANKSVFYYKRNKSHSLILTCKAQSSPLWQNSSSSCKQKTQQSET